MTNSTDKKIKKKGPIRFEAIIPVVVFLGLLIAYFTFLFDWNLKQALEFGGTRINGAEVNVESVDTSFLGASLNISNIQVTDKENPVNNIVQIEKINFQFLWDALLRAKFVINEASIQNIQANSPRKTPGRVIPSDTEESKALQAVEDSVLEQTKDQFNDNVLADVANIVDGTDPSKQLKNIESELKSDKKIKELKQALKEKRKEWKKRIDNLPQKEEINALIAKSKKLKFNTKKPKQLKKDLDELKKLLKEGDAIVKEFKTTSKSIKTDAGKFNKDMKGIDELIKQDVRDLQKRLKIPSLDVADFSKGLFGKMFNDKLGKYKKYMTMARQYLPPKKDAEEKTDSTPTPKARKVGRDFHYPVTKGYPLFWLQEGKISSEPGASELSGRVDGLIKNVTSHPQQLGIPATIDINGDFPKQGISGFKANIVIDHTTDSPYEKIDASISSFPVGRQSLSDSDDVKFAIKDAVGSTEITGVSREGKIHFMVKNWFSEVNYDIQAKSNTVDEVLKSVVAGIPVVTVDAGATGEWSKLNWKVKSNLGGELSKGFRKQLDAKVKEAKAKLDQFINGKISGQKKELDSEYKAAKGEVDKKIGAKKKEIDSAQKNAKKVAKKKEKEATGGKDMKKEAKKAEKKLKEALGF